MPWDEINRSVFLLVNATPASPRWLVQAAIWLAEFPVILALVLFAGQLWKNRDGRATLYIGLAVAISLSIEWLVAAFAYQPRPFASGFGYQWAQHAANNSMPSTHTALVWIMALAALQRGNRLTGAILMLTGALVGWARVYIGIHWPADIAGSALSALAGIVIAQAAFGILKKD